ncbi:unnamed protein product [Macrosiphum euphorbiae]|uniref:Multiple inositol polyphosphate phosphatase 1 n=2 Tax=Macrosiphum euphorbiae TaxID=13131 RepID=A0AAV0VTM6_9HEMI|nr:unnamed protein product [Macrosiphum euphorbiae]
MMGQSSRLLLLLAFLFSADLSGGEPCFEQNDPEPYVYFSHKTAYQLILNSKFKPVPYCRPTFVWMFITPGTSYPNTNESMEIRNLHLFKNRVIKNHEERRNGYLCPNVLDSLKRWEFEVNPSSEDDISPQGRMDMQLLARRMKDKMSEVLAKEIDPNTFKIYATEDRKVMNSAEEFSKTMFGNDFRSKVPIEIIENNSSFIGLESCPKWNDAVYNSEASLFRKSPEYLDMVSQMSKRLGFLENITESIIHSMYESCRYHKALVIESYPAWCGLFTRQELQLLEYHDDLEYYYKYGYGSEINTKVGCPIAKELMGYLNDVSKNYSDGPSAVLRFGSSAGLLTTLLALGVARDTIPLTHSNYAAQYRRQWRMSRVDPFSSNFAVVFYKCSQGDEENKVMFYLNEGVYDYPGCNVGLCSWKFFENKFKDYLGPKGCNEEVCHDKSRASGVRHSVFVAALIPIVLAYLRV